MTVLPAQAQCADQAACTASRTGSEVLERRWLWKCDGLLFSIEVCGGCDGLLFSVVAYGCGQKAPRH